VQVVAFVADHVRVLLAPEVMVLELAANVTVGDVDAGVGAAGLEVELEELVELESTAPERDVF
jgi:hypothetical protein